jgi:hypothetical protein
MTAVGLAIKLTMRSTSNIYLIGLALASLGVPVASRILLALRLIVVGLAWGPSTMLMLELATNTTKPVIDRREYRIGPSSRAATS